MNEKNKPDDMPAVVPPGYYDRAFFADAWKTRVDRGEQARARHCNVNTVSRVRRFFRDFDAEVYCTDPSLHPVSLILAPWFGRQITAVVRKRKKHAGHS